MRKLVVEGDSTIVVLAIVRYFYLCSNRRLSDLLVCISGAHSEGASLYYCTSKYIKPCHTGAISPSSCY